MSIIYQLIISWEFKKSTYISSTIYLLSDLGQVTSMCFGFSTYKLNPCVQSFLKVHLEHSKCLLLLILSGFLQSVGLFWLYNCQSQIIHTFLLCCVISVRGIAHISLPLALIWPHRTLTPYKLPNKYPRGFQHKTLLVFEKFVWYWCMFQMCRFLEGNPTFGNHIGVSKHFKLHLFPTKLSYFSSHSSSSSQVLHASSPKLANEESFSTSHAFSLPLPPTPPSHTWNPNNYASKISCSIPSLP